jgi:hypothetical protein
MRTVSGQPPRAQLLQPQIQQPPSLQTQLSGGLNSGKGRATPRSVGTKVTGPGVPQPMFAPTSSAYQHHFQRKRGGKAPRGSMPAFGASRAGSAKGKGLLDEAAEALLGMGMDIEDASMQVGPSSMPSALWLATAAQRVLLCHCPAHQVFLHPAVTGCAHTARSLIVS